MALWFLAFNTQLHVNICQEWHEAESLGSMSPNPSMQTSNPPQQQSTFANLLPSAANPGYPLRWAKQPVREWERKVATSKAAREKHAGEK